MAAAKKTPTPNKKPPRATVRTYRHGLGDCHLVTLYGARKARYQIMIDCGVILGTPNAGAVMTEVMDDILAATGGSIDLLVATHEHWDHVSGFAQAAESFAKLKVGAVWLGWTEDPKDADAKKLRGERDNALALLRAAAVRMQLDGDGDDEPSLLTSLLDFFGAAARTTTASALELVRAKAARPRVRRSPSRTTSSPSGSSSIKTMRETSTAVRCPSSSNPSRCTARIFASCFAFSTKHTRDSEFDKM